MLARHLFLRALDLRRYDRRRGSRSSDDAPVLVDGEVPKELLDREGGSSVLTGADDARKSRVAANLRALADDADKVLCCSVRPPLCSPAPLLW